MPYSPRAPHRARGRFILFHSTRAMEPDAQNAAAPAPQIRTYASDVAKLTGKPMPAGVKNEVANPRAPLPPPPAKIVPKAPTTDEKREEVLARLKTKSAPQASAPVVAPAAVIPNAPTTTEKREEVLARLKKQAPKAAPQPIAAVKTPEFTPGIPPISKDVPLPSPIHTYKTDFSDKTKSEGASPISVLAAQADASTPAPIAVRPKRSNMPLYVAGATVLIIAGGASMFFAYQIISGRPTLPQELAVSSLIFADQRVELSGNSDELTRGLVKMEELALSDGGVAIAYMTYATTTADKKEIRVAAQGGALVQALGLVAPNILLRNVGPASTLGVVASGGETRPFFVLRVTSFERTFAGMLEWEKTMRDDLSVFYPAYPSTVTLPVATTSSSTPSTTQLAPLPPRGFMDVIVENHDARVIKDGEGRTVLIYGYRDKETLVIARNEAAFRELLSRLSSTSSR